MSDQNKIEQVLSSLDFSKIDVDSDGKVKVGGEDILLKLQEAGVNIDDQAMMGVNVNQCNETGCSKV